MKPSETEFNVEQLYPETDKQKIVLTYLKSMYFSIHDLKYNFLGVITGKHRVGKSTDSLVFSSILDRTFWDNMEERVVYFPEQFMKALRNLAKQRIIGGAIVWDEAGVGIPARSWYDISNKSINFVTQVMGYLRPIIFFVTQDMTYIDSQPRKLFHSFYECYRGSKDRNTIKPFNISYDKRMGKIYYIYPRIYRRIEDVNGTLVKLKNITVTKPPKDFIERYEEHSFDFKQKILLQMEERIRKFDTEDIVNKKSLTQREILDMVIQNYKKYETKRSSFGNVILDANIIRFDFSIPYPLARFIKADAERQINEKHRSSDEWKELHEMQNEKENDFRY